MDSFFQALPERRAGGPVVCDQVCTCLSRWISDMLRNKECGVESTALCGRPVWKRCGISDSDGNEKRKGSVTGGSG